ncbi:MAG: DUF4465 domain-containing protein [Akkermansiaceae bacterium]|nr:DUF4465 domain-containing protein [Akkermansiaceae bacterium]
MLVYASTLLGFALATASGAVVTFESVPLGAPNGPSGVWNGQAGTGGLTIDGVNFNNSYTAFEGGFFDWRGFAYSNKTDTTTPGFGNQFSSIAGGGAGGSSQYALSYANGASIKFTSNTNLTDLGTSITNTTYAGLSMLNGDSFAKKFGGISGNDPDFFKLTITGYVGGSAVGSPLDFYLADFRFEDNSRDYIIDEWTFLNLSPLGTVDELRFSYTSSDNGDFGINTPVYFALDNFLSPVPEPSAFLLVMLGGIGAVIRRRR